MNKKTRSSAKMIYATCILYVLIVVVVYQISQPVKYGRISNFILSQPVPMEPVFKTSPKENRQSIDLSICFAH